MKGSQIFTHFENIPFFTVEGYKQLLEEESPGARYVATTLYRWMKAGKIVQLKKGVYMTRRFYELHLGDVDFMPAMSTIILPQSYLSLEYVLQRHGILTDVTYPVTAITMKNTRTVENSLGTFAYRHIKPDLYQGFTITEYLRIPFAQASLAKALFDYLYFRPLRRAILTTNYDLAEDLRLNLDELSHQDREEFAGYVLSSRFPKMERILENLKRTIWQP
jgi:hypothetical protein